MKISKAMPLDIPQLNALLYHLFTQESEFEPHPKKQENALKTLLYNSQVGDIFVARIDNKIVGMVSLLYTVSTALGGTVALLEDMIVLPEYRQRGIGSSLMEYALQYAQEQGCKRITLLTDKENLKAHNFYTKNNFKTSSMVIFRQKL